MADALRGAHRDGEAVQLYRTTLAIQSGVPEVFWCQRELAGSLIRTGDLAAAQAAMDKLLCDYSTHPDIAGAVRDRTAKMIF